MFADVVSDAALLGRLERDVAQYHAIDNVGIALEFLARNVQSYRMDAGRGGQLSAHRVQRTQQRRSRHEWLTARLGVLFDRGAMKLKGCSGGYIKQSPRAGCRSASGSHRAAPLRRGQETNMRGHLLTSCFALALLGNTAMSAGLAVAQQPPPAAEPQQQQQEAPMTDKVSLYKAGH
jgi:hypothetical protein